MRRKKACGRTSRELSPADLAARLSNPQFKLDSCARSFCVATGCVGWGVRRAACVLFPSPRQCLPVPARPLSTPSQITLTTVYSWCCCRAGQVCAQSLRSVTLLCQWINLPPACPPALPPAHHPVCSGLIPASWTQPSAFPSLVVLELAHMRLDKQPVPATWCALGGILQVALSSEAGWLYASSSLLTHKKVEWQGAAPQAFCLTWLP